MLSRALAEPDVDHEVWWATTYTLEKRHDPAVWNAAAALCDRSDPLERYFGAEVLRYTNIFDEDEDAPHDRSLVDLFLPWVEREPDPRVAWVLTAGLADAMDPRAGKALPALTRHLDAKVREWAVGGLGSAIEMASPKALVAVTERIGDANAAVRQAACRALAFAPPDTADASDLLAGCLVDPDENVRVEAAARLALRDDPRGDEILRGLDPTDEDSPTTGCSTTCPDTAPRAAEHRQRTPATATSKSRTANLDTQPRHIKRSSATSSAQSHRVGVQPQMSNSQKDRVRGGFRRDRIAPQSRAAVSRRPATIPSDRRTRRSRRCRWFG